MIGPSAMGSENGTPTSTTSTPALSSPASSSSVASGDGCPAVIYGTSARRPPARSCAKRSATRSDEVVADTNAVPIGLVRLDDRSLERAVLPAVSEIDEVSRKENVPPRVTHNTNDWAREHFRDGIAGMHQAQLECIENDERTDGEDAGEVHERLHEHGIHTPAWVVAHLLHHGGWIQRRRLIRATGCGRVEAIRDRDDLAENAHLSRTHGPRIAGEVDLHVMFLRDDHRAVMKVLRSTKLKQAEHTHPWVRGDLLPLVVGEALNLVEHLRWYARLADVMEERGHTEIVELELR